MNLLRNTFLTLAALLAAALAPPAAAQQFPSRPVKVIVPFPAGGGTDALSRILAAALEKNLAQPFVVENVAGGAGGNVGAGRAAASSPDGYTLLIGSMGLVSVNPLIYRNTGNSIMERLTPISLVFESGHLIVVHPSVPAATLAELATVAKSADPELTYASGGPGTSTHLYAELFKLLTSSPITHVPYRGNGPALQDVIAGHAKVMFDQIGNSSEQVRAGSVRGLAVTTMQRVPILPNVPTAVEAGMPQMSGTSWAMLMAPRETPKPIIDQLNAAIAAVLADPETRARMEAIGASARFSSVQEAEALMRTELERWRPVVEAAKLQAN